MASLDSVANLQRLGLERFHCKRQCSFELIQRFTTQSQLLMNHKNCSYCIYPNYHVAKMSIIEYILYMLKFFVISIICHGLQKG